MVRAYLIAGAESPAAVDDAPGAPEDDASSTSSEPVARGLQMSRFHVSDSYLKVYVPVIDMEPYFDYKGTNKRPRIYL